jgi:hypothetical protein
MTALQISSDIVTSNTTLIPARDCLSMPLNMELSFAHPNVAAVEGVWYVACGGLYQPPTDAWRWSFQVVLLGAPTSLASIMVSSVRTTPPSYTSEVAPKWVSASGSTWFGKGSIHKKVLV